MKKFAVGLCLVVMASLCAAPVSATLIGDEVTVSIFFSGAVQDSATGIAGTDDLSVVGFFSDELFTPTFSDTTITILYSSLANTEWLAGEFLIFSGLDWGGLGQLTGVSITSTDNSDITNVSQSGIDEIRLELGYTVWRPGDEVVLTLTAEHKDIPEPTTMALLGMGAAGLIARRRAVC